MNGMVGEDEAKRSKDADATDTGETSLYEFNGRKQLCVIKLQ